MTVARAVTAAVVLLAGMACLLFFSSTGAGTLRGSFGSSHRRLQIATPATPPPTPGVSTAVGTPPPTQNPWSEDPLQAHNEVQKDDSNDDEQWWERYKKGRKTEGSLTAGTCWAQQFILGVIFYLLVASKYQPRAGNEHSAQILEESPCCRIEPGAKCFLAWFCPAAQLAHACHQTRTCNYWAALCCSIWYPCTAAWCALSFTSMYPNLGAGKKNCCIGAIEAHFCGCCVIHQLVDAVDAASGLETECCGVDRADGYGSESEPGFQ